MRRDVSIQSATPGVRIHAHEYRPTNEQGADSAPVVIGGPGFALTKTNGLEPYANALTQTGYAAVFFAYRSFGQSEGTPRHVAGIKMQQEDFHSVLAWTRSQARFDSSRIALMGTALGGGHAISVAARDGGVAAVLALCPMVNAKETGKGALGFWTLPIILYIILDKLLSAIGVPPLYLLTTHPYDEKLQKANTWVPALISNPSAPKGYKECDPGQPRYVAARYLMEHFGYMPVEEAEHMGLKCPTLFIVPAGDTICPRAAYDDYINRVPNARMEVVGSKDTTHFAVLEGSSGSIAQEASHLIADFLFNKVAI